MLRLSLITASNRQPEWVDAGADDYAKRLRGRCTLEIKAVPLARRTATAPAERARRRVARDRQAVVDKGSRPQARGLDAARRAGRAARRRSRRLGPRVR